MKTDIRYSFFISLFLPLVCFAQFPVGYYARIGFDPVATSTFLFPMPDQLKTSKYHYQNGEVHAELVGPFRTSGVVEVGYTNVFYNAKEGTFLYNNHGFYTRFGFNFDLSEPKKNYEVDLGWRIGIGQNHESGLVHFPGTYWKSEYEFAFPENHSIAHWAEVMLVYRFRPFPKSKSLKNLWAGFSIRGKVIPSSGLENEEYKRYYLPGYGFGNPFTGGFQFKLEYTLHFKRKEVHKVHHLHDNIELIYKKNHVNYKRKKYNDVDELERE